MMQLDQQYPTIAKHNEEWKGIINHLTMKLIVPFSCKTIFTDTDI
jgi:hypothetical protein